MSLSAGYRVTGVGTATAQGAENGNLKDRIHEWGDASEGREVRVLWKAHTRRLGVIPQPDRRL